MQATFKINLSVQFCPILHYLSINFDIDGFMISIQIDKYSTSNNAQKLIIKANMNNRSYYFLLILFPLFLAAFRFTIYRLTVAY